MKIFKHEDGRRTLRMSKAEVRTLSKKAGWEDLFEEEEEEEGLWTDIDLGDVDVEDVLTEMEEEEQARTLFTDPVDDEYEYVAQCEEAMSMLAPVMKTLAEGEYIDLDSLLNELLDAVGPLVGEDVDISNPLGVVRTFLSTPDRPEDEDLKRGIRTIMGMAGIPLEEVEEAEEEVGENVESSTRKPPLGFHQSSDLWYRILNKKK